jgi:hypothetical protein
MVPGNLRAALQTFEGGEVDDMSQRCTYRMQHDTTRIATLVNSVTQSLVLFTFSPFGLCCQQCVNNMTIPIDTRSIQIHLKKQGLDSRAASVRVLVEGFMAQRVKAKASGSIDAYRSDNNTYVGYACTCG